VSAREIRTEIDIGAPAERVWAVLTAFAEYPRWNPFIPRITGTPVEGARLQVRIEPPGGRGMTFRPTVLRAAPPRELRWRGRLLVPGLLDGEHVFAIEPAGARAVRFLHSERFEGLLVPLLWTNLDRRTRQGFDEMNRALKAEAERRVG
jgi:hypothetical protein